MILPKGISSYFDALGPEAFDDGIFFGIRPYKAGHFM